MKGFLFLVAALCSCSLTCGGPLSQFFESVDEIPYTVLEKTQDYELRQYPALKLVCTSMDDINPGDDPMNGWQKEYWNNPYLAMMFGGWRNSPTSQMFKRLFGYIGGANMDNKKIAMTAPVTISHNPSTDSYAPLEKQAECFWLGAEEAPPASLRQDVFLQNARPQQFYVTRFSGFALSDDDFRNPYNEFRQVLANKDVARDTWKSVSYDAPFVPFNRRNEVWIPKN